MCDASELMNGSCSRARFLRVENVVNKISNMILSTTKYLNHGAPFCASILTVLLFTVVHAV